jgi:5-methylcytosine-specific restriction protein B
MAKGIPTLEEFLKEYDRNADDAEVKLAEDEREELIARYPLEKWPTMPLDRYALGLGHNEDSFCWWMEWGTPHAGSMRGGSSFKHIIFRQRDGSWYFDRKSYPNEQAAWEAIRAGFLDAFGKAERGEWALIDEIEAIETGPALRTKTLHCYFPSKL